MLIEVSIARDIFINYSEARCFYIKNTRSLKNLMKYNTKEWGVKYFIQNIQNTIIKAKGVPSGILDFDALQRIHKGEVIEFNRKQLHKSLELFSIFEKELPGNVKLTIPTGKVPIIGEDGLISGYKDVHKSVLASIKEGALRSGLSLRLQKLIDKYRSKVDSTQRYRWELYYTIVYQHPTGVIFSHLRRY